MVIESTDMNVSIPFFIEARALYFNIVLSDLQFTHKKQTEPEVRDRLCKKADLHTSQYESQEALFFSNLQEDASSNPIVIV